MGTGLEALSHLIFGDDTLLLGKASVEEAGAFKDILNRFKEWSGQLVSVQKSTVMFSPNVDAQTRSNISQILGKPEATSHGKYLGIPTSIGDFKKKIYWISWDTLCKSKDDGGLGFKKTQDFNNALLYKQTWKLLKEPKSHLFRVYKARYFSNGDFLLAELGQKSSFTWRSLLYVRDLVNRETMWQLGNVKSINVWTQRWVAHTYK
ncbi:hypothetical protein LIER_06561 [Lithospermum erythrorhizon]|uniref:Reverse transcriptase domain-containing protein n=1 Tax=Lithospermum erythrorhizon TaxID=34254 RepID=A0AAV3P7H4_LITER